ncbi:hypothetical protein SEA_DAMASCUS_8 [Microbacterium phage Damascus]|nr:hypothetical protein SEA_DAMASCUS_8 [Microbacterium phage Damascus]
MADPTQQVENSILHDVKQIVGQEWDDTTFDLDIKTHINSVFADLEQIGVGPKDGFEITDHTQLWDEYLLGNVKLNSVKSYIYIRVRLLFDPPATGPLAQSLQAQADKWEWRLMVQTDPPLPNSTVGVVND